VREPSALSPRFLALYLNYFKDQLIVPLMVGAANMSLTVKRLGTVPVRFPSAAVQRRIIETLAEADDSRRLRDQADRRTGDIIPAIFHELFGNHFVTTPITTSVGNSALPDGWRWARLTEVARLATGHTPSRRVPEYWNGTIPWISTSDIRALDGHVVTNTSESVTQQGIENSSAVILPKGTVCLARTAASVGLVTVMGREMATSQDFVNWVCYAELNPFYLMCTLIVSRKYLLSLASGSTHKTIYFPVAEQFCALVPPMTCPRFMVQAL
jgi:type I restriction enzyme S subunit